MQEIRIKVQLDAEKLPDKIIWTATDKPIDVPDDVKAMAVSFWDHKNNCIVKLDLWTKDMLVGEMKRFILQTIGGLGDTLFNATDDEYMQGEIQQLCQNLAQYIEKEEKRR
jgi:gliding motility-associated protein GldC